MNSPAVFSNKLGRFASTKRIQFEIEGDLTFWSNFVGLPEVVAFDSGFSGLKSHLAV